MGASPEDFLEFDCKPAKKQMLQIHPGYEDFRVDHPLSFTCSGREPMKSDLPIGLGVGLRFLLILFIALMAYRIRRPKSRKTKAAKEQLPDYEVEIENRRTGGGDVLPEYSPPVNGESVERASEERRLSDVTRQVEGPLGQQGEPGTGA